MYSVFLVNFGYVCGAAATLKEAKKIAKANALEEYSSEFLLSDREIRCHENDLDASCEFTKSIYSQYSS